MQVWRRSTGNVLRMCAHQTEISKIKTKSNVSTRIAHKYFFIKNHTIADILKYTVKWIGSWT